MQDKTYFVYILASSSRRLYIGVTSDLERRVWQHKHKVVRGFSQRYNVDRLVHYECTSDVYSAIQREKRLKEWPRAWKIKLIEEHNPEWRDLAEEWSAVNGEGIPDTARQARGKP